MYAKTAKQLHIWSMYIVCIGVSTPHQKYRTPLSCQAFQKSTNCLSALSRQSLAIYWFFATLLKIGFYSKPQKY